MKSLVGAAFLLFLPSATFSHTPNRPITGYGDYPFGDKFVPTREWQLKKLKPFGPNYSGYEHKLDDHVREIMSIGRDGRIVAYSRTSSFDTSGELMKEWHVMKLHLTAVYGDPQVIIEHIPESYDETALWKDGFPIFRDLNAYFDVEWVDRMQNMLSMSISNSGEIFLRYESTELGDARDLIDRRKAREERRLATDTSGKY